MKIMLEQKKIFESHISYMIYTQYVVEFGREFSPQAKFEEVCVCIYIFIYILIYIYIYIRWLEISKSGK